MSCLFNSMSHFIPQDSNTIRQTICDYLQNNNNIIDGLSTSTILELENNNYIQRMRSMSTWGGAIEIQAACNIWSLRIIVNNRRDNPHTKIEFIPISSKFDNTIELEWTGGHYEPIN